MLSAVVPVIDQHTACLVLGNRQIQPAGSRHGGEPFAHIALCETGRFRKLHRRARPPVHHRAEQAEMIAEHDENARYTGAEIAHEATDECIDFLHVRLLHIGFLLIGSLHGTLLKMRQPQSDSSTR